MTTQRLLSRALRALLCVALLWTPVAAASAPRVEVAAFVVERAARPCSAPRPRPVTAASRHVAPHPAAFLSFEAPARALSPRVLPAQRPRAPLYILHQALLR